MRVVQKKLNQELSVGRADLFFFNDTATTEIYTLSLHDALPISTNRSADIPGNGLVTEWPSRAGDRKSTRLNSSHGSISYAVFCLKKKNHYGTQGFQYTPTLPLLQSRCAAMVP